MGSQCCLECRRKSKEFDIKVKFGAVVEVLHISRLDLWLIHLIWLGPKVGPYCTWLEVCHPAKKYCEFYCT